MDNLTPAEKAFREKKRPIVGVLRQTFGALGNLIAISEQNRFPTPLELRRTCLVYDKVDKYLDELDELALNR